jgi:hypothetical protein
MFRLFDGFQRHPERTSPGGSDDVENLPFHGVIQGELPGVEQHARNGGRRFKSQRTESDQILHLKSLLRRGTVELRIAQGTTWVNKTRKAKESVNVMDRVVHEGSDSIES